jgi:aspartate racemase
MNPPIIGIVGGVGPYAGLDLNRKVFDNTITDGTDQGHLEVLLFSAGRRIPDRSDYLAGRISENPAEGIFQAVRTLARAGARFVAIACNTAHSPEIIEPLKEKIKDLDLNLELVDMIEETGLFIRQYYGRGVKTGLLATEGTYKSGVYERLAGDIELVIPSRKIRELVHRAIYDRTFGIKAFSNPLTEQAVEDCRSAVRHLTDKGAKLVILGCTELPLALPEQSMAGVALLDPAWITARALVSKAAPDKLKEYRPEVCPHILQGE